MFLIVFGGFFVPNKNLFSQTANIPLGTCIVTKKYANAPPPIVETFTNISSYDCARKYIAPPTETSSSWTPNNAAENQAAIEESESNYSKSPLSVLGTALGFAAEKWVAPVLSWIFWLVQKILSFWMGLNGIILNWVLKVTVVDMSKNISNMIGINIVWKMVKDLMNIVFIFMLVYYGILLIIGQKSLDSIRSFIAMIILAALLVNFSLFFTKVLIDASNVVTIGFYKALVSNSGGIQSGGTNPNTGNTDSISGLSNTFQQALNLQSFYDKESVQGNGYGPLIASLSASVLFFITGFIFFAISVMFVIRYVVLIILLALSPVAYMSMALPGIKGYASEWWKSLNGQLIFAPLFMIMMYITITLINSEGFIHPSAKGASWSGIQTATESGAGVISGGSLDSSVSLIFNFAVIISLVVASLIVSKKYASQGSTYIGKATGNLTSFAGGALMGGAAAVGRRTVGAGASRLSQSQTFQDWAGRSLIGEQALKGTRYAASSNFDVRSSRLGSAVTKNTGVDLGKAQQGGYDKTLQDQISKKDKFAQSLSTDAQKQAYAQRQMSGVVNRFYTRGGSQAGHVQSVFGTMGRSNRILASRILNNQIQPLQTQLTALQNNLQNMQNRDSQLNQQLNTAQANLINLQNLPQANRQPNHNQQVQNLQNSINNVQNQINNNNTNMTNAQNQINAINPMIQGLNGQINTYGLTNPGNLIPLTPQQQIANNAFLASLTPAQQQANAVAQAAGQPLPHPLPHQQRQARADEQNY